MRYGRGPVQLPLDAPPAPAGPVDTALSRVTAPASARRRQALRRRVRRRPRTRPRPPRRGPRLPRRHQRSGTSPSSGSWSARATASPRPAAPTAPCAWRSCWAPSPSSSTRASSGCSGAPAPRSRATSATRCAARRTSSFPSGHASSAFFAASLLSERRPGARPALVLAGRRGGHVPGLRSHPPRVGHRGRRRGRVGPGGRRQTALARALSRRTRRCTPDGIAARAAAGCTSRAPDLRRDLGLPLSLRPQRPRARARRAGRRRRLGRHVPALLARAGPRRGGAARRVGQPGRRQRPPRRSRWGWPCATPCPTGSSTPTAPSSTTGTSTAVRCRDEQELAQRAEGDRARRRRRAGRGGVRSTPGHHQGRAHRATPPVTTSGACRRSSSATRPRSSGSCTGPTATPPSPGRPIERVRRRCSSGPT